MHLSNKADTELTGSDRPPKIHETALGRNELITFYIERNIGVILHLTVKIAQRTGSSRGQTEFLGVFFPRAKQTFLRCFTNAAETLDTQTQAKKPNDKHTPNVKLCQRGQSKPEIIFVPVFPCVGLI